MSNAFHQFLFNVVHCYKLLYQHTLPVFEKLTIN